jgi:hypothetical protein
LPVFYVAEATDGRIMVSDGLQRLTTFDRYLSGKFALEGKGDVAAVAFAVDPHVISPLCFRL